MDESITILLALEARDKASEVMKAAKAAIGDFGSAIKAAATQASRSSADIEAANTRAAAASASYGRASAAQSEAQAALSAAMDRSAAAAEMSGRAATQGAAEQARAAAFVTDAAAAEEAALIRVQEAEKLAAARSKEMADAQKAASTETGLGAAAFKGAALAGGVAALSVAAVGLSAVKAAGDFQSSTSRLVTSAGESGTAINSVRDGMLKMAGQVGYSTGQLADAMYKVESGGQHGAAGLTVLRAAAEGAKTENADLTTVADALTSVMVDYKVPADQAATVTSKLVEATSKGKMTFEELAGSLSAIMPTASAAHVSLSDVLGDMAAMTVHGMSAQQASQNLADTIRHMQNPTAVQAKELATLGMTTAQLADDLKSKGLSGTLQDIQEHIAKMMPPGSDKVILNLKTALQGLSPQVRELGQHLFDGSMSMKDYTKAAQGLDPISAKQAMSFGTLAGSMHRIGDQQTSGAQVMQTYGAALAKATGDSTGLNVALMLTGDNAGVANDAVKGVGGAVAEAGNHVKGWATVQDNFNQKMAQLKGTVEAAKISLGQGLLPVVTQIASAVAKVLTPIAEWMAKHKELSAIILVSIGGLGALVAITWALTAAFAALSATPIVAIIIGIIAAVALLAVGVYELYEKWQPFHNFVVGSWHLIQQAASIAWSVLKAIFDGVKTAVVAVGDVFSGLVARVTPLWHEITSAISSEWDKVWAKVQDIAQLLVQIWAKIAPAIMPWVHMFTSEVLAAWDLVQGATKVAFDMIWAFIKGDWDLIVGVVKAAVAILIGVLKIGWDVIVGAVRIAWEAIKLVINVALDLIRGILRVALDLLSGNWSKAWQDMLAMVRNISNDISSFLRGVWNAIWQMLSGIWNAISQAAIGVWRGISSGVLGWAHSMWDGLKGAFNAGVDALSAAWNRLKDAAMVPVRFVVQHVINPLIGGYNAIAGAFGVHQVKTIGGFRAGGSVFGPGGETADMIPALLSHNEHVWTASEVKAAGGHKAVERIRAMVLGHGLPTYPGDGSAGIPRFAGGGGVLGSIGNFFGDIWSAITNPGAVVSKLVGGALGAIPGGGAIKDVLAGMGHTLINGLTHFITGGGGGAGNLGKARAFLMAQNGKPYVWASAGPGGYDCSGIVSAVWNVLHGRNPYSHTFSTMNEASYFPKAAHMGILTAGWTNPGEPGPGGNSVGHTAGILAGLPFESTGSRGVHMGAGVTPIGEFAHWGTYDQGGPIYPGLNLVMNKTGGMEWVQNPNAPSGVYIDLRESKFMSDRDIDALLDKLDKRLARTLVPNAGVQVRR